MLTLTPDLCLEESVIALTVALDMDTPADSFTLTLAATPQAQAMHVGQMLRIALGQGRASRPVMAGRVAEIDAGLTTWQVTGYSAFDALLGLHVDASYANVTAGEIVGSLAAYCRVPVSEIEPGMHLQFYAVDNWRSVYQHMRHLADISGCDLYCDHDGGLVFEPYRAGKTIHTVTYGEDLLSIETRLEKHQRHRQRFSGRVTVLGRPSVRLGDALVLCDVPVLPASPDFGGSYQIRGITHRLSKSAGFVTEIRFCSPNVCL